MNLKGSQPLCLHVFSRPGDAGKAIHHLNLIYNLNALSGEITMGSLNVGYIFRGEIF